MCGRLVGTDPVEDPELLVEMFKIIKESPDIFPPGRRYNIAPTQNVPIIREMDGARRFASLRWGLLPAWVKDRATFKSTLINARAETVFEKPSFRSPVRRRRCIVPACGYYEWKTEGKEKTPHFIKARDDSVLFVAGLWERWNAKDGGEAIESFTVVTTEASGPLKSIHDRMPVILSLADCGAWLDPAISDPTDLKPLLRPAPADLLEFYPVSKAVNKPSNDGPDLIKRAG